VTARRTATCKRTESRDVPDAAEVTRHARRDKTDVMPFRWPSEQEPFALFHLSVSTTASFSNYYDSVDVLMPFLRDRAWIDACAGYYLDSIDRGLPRLTYFASDAGVATRGDSGDTLLVSAFRTKWQHSGLIPRISLKVRRKSGGDSQTASLTSVL